MAEPHRVVITGMGRTGTLWMSIVLNRHPEVKATHEPFNQGSWPQAFTRWSRTPGEHVVMVNSYARFFIEEIEKKIHPTWAFLWRDPVTLMASAVRRAIDNKAKTQKVHVDKRTHNIFKQLEDMMVRIEDNNIVGSHWYMDYYSTQPGIIHLAEVVGIPVPDPFSMGGNKHASRAPAPKWDDTTKDTIRAIAYSYPRVGDIYRGIGKTCLLP